MIYCDCDCEGCNIHHKEAPLVPDDERCTFCDQHEISRDTEARKINACFACYLAKINGAL